MQSAATTTSSFRSGTTAGAWSSRTLSARGLRRRCSCRPSGRRLRRWSATIWPCAPSCGARTASFTSRWRKGSTSRCSTGVLDIRHPPPAVFQRGSRAAGPPAPRRRRRAAGGRRRAARACSRRRATSTATPPWRKATCWRSTRTAWSRPLDQEEQRVRSGPLRGDAGRRARRRRRRDSAARLMRDVRQHLAGGARGRPQPRRDEGEPRWLAACGNLIVRHLVARGRLLAVGLLAGGLLLALPARPVAHDIPGRP